MVRVTFMTPGSAPVTTHSTPGGPHLAKKSTTSNPDSLPLNQELQALDKRRTSEDVRSQSSSMCLRILATTTAATPAGCTSLPPVLRRHRELHTAYRNSRRNSVHNPLCCSSAGVHTRWSSARSTKASRGGRTPPMHCHMSSSQSTAGRTLGHSMKRCVRVSGCC